MSDEALYAPISHGSITMITTSLPTASRAKCRCRLGALLWRGYRLVPHTAARLLLPGRCETRAWCTHRCGKRQKLEICASFRLDAARSAGERRSWIRGNL